MSIDYSKGRLLPLSTIHPYSEESLGDALTVFGGTLFLTVSGAWPSANTAIFIPFGIAAPIVVEKMFIHNGATVSGNVDVGIYDESGNRLVSSGSTAQAGVSALQVFDVTNTNLYPGRYFLAVTFDNTTGTILVTSMPGTSQKSFGVLQRTLAFPLPVTVTFQASSLSPVPLVGLSLKSTI